MKNCCRLTRRDRERIARTINSVQANAVEKDIIAFGRWPFPMRDVAPMFPRLKVTAFLNARKETRIQRFWRVAEPWLWALLLAGLTVAAIWAAK